MAKGGGLNSRTSLANVYGRLGRSKEARDILEDLKRSAKEQTVSGYQYALIYVGLGDAESALQSLEQAYRDHSTLLSYMKMDPRLDPLRSNSRFQDLLRQMNFPQ